MTTTFSPPDQARFLVMVHINEERKKNRQTKIKLKDEDVFVVWFCYILGGWKALLSTTLPDGMYYEVTYNKEQRETYLDAYTKLNSVVFPDDEPS